MSTEIKESIDTSLGIVDDINSITTDRIKYQEALKVLDEELKQSTIYKRIEAGKLVLQELQEKEGLLRKEGIALLEKSGVESIKTSNTEIRLKVSPGRVIVKEIELIPTEFIKEKVEIKKTVDKKGLKKAMSEGELFDGAVLEQDVTLVIKQL